MTSIIIANIVKWNKHAGTTLQVINLEIIQYRLKIVISVHADVDLITFCGIFLAKDRIFSVDFPFPMIKWDTQPCD